MESQPFRILGVHSISAPQPCYLIEVALENPAEELDWGLVTQEDAKQLQSNWQVAYDERPLDDEHSRWAFFFHYLDFSKLLLTPIGPVELPTPTTLPERLQHIEYVEP